MAADHNTGWADSQVGPDLSPRQHLSAPERCVGAGDQLLAADLLQVVSLFAEVVAGTAAIPAGGDSAVRVVTLQVETGGAVRVNP